MFHPAAGLLWVLVLPLQLLDKLKINMMWSQKTRNHGLSRKLPHILSFQRNNIYRTIKLCNHWKELSKPKKQHGDDTDQRQLQEFSERAPWNPQTLGIETSFWRISFVLFPSFEADATEKTSYNFGLRYDLVPRLEHEWLEHSAKRSSHGDWKSKSSATWDLLAKTQPPRF